MPVECRIPNFGADSLTKLALLFIRRCLVLVLYCTTLFAPGFANATEWYVQPSVKVSTQYDNNLLLTPVHHTGTTEATVAPHLEFGAAQANWDVQGSAEWRGHRYWGQNGLNGNDQVYNLSSLYRTPRTTWQLGASYAKESVTANSLFIPDIGLVSSVTPRITRTVNPSWTWQMSQRMQLLLNYQTSVVTYNAPGSSLVNYTSRDGSATLQYQWSHRNQLTAELDQSYFNVPQLSLSQIGQPAYTETVNGLFTLLPNPQLQRNTSTTDSALLGWSHTFSPTLSGNISMGTSRTDSDIVVQSCTASTSPSIYFVNGQFVGLGTCTQTANSTYTETSSGYLYSAGLDKQFQLTQVTLSLGRQISPSGIGAQVRMDSATLGVNRTFSPRLSGGLDLSGYRIRSISSASPPLTDRDLDEGSINLTWDWTRQLTVQGGYRYVEQKYLSNSVKAHDNAVYLSLAYAWRRNYISR